MTAIDPRKRARMAVSERLRAFFDRLKQQLSSDTEQFWKRVRPSEDGDKKQT